VDGFKFQRRANLSDFKVAFDRHDEPAKGSWTHLSEGAVSWSIQVKAGAQVIPNVPQGTAGLSVQFSKMHAVALLIPSGTQSRIANIQQLRAELENSEDEAIQRLFDEGQFVVTEVVKADSASAFISEANEASLVATADADFRAGIQSLGDATLGFSLASANNVQTELQAQGNTTPLFRGVQLGVNWIGQRTVREALML
jgi:hypothetical protein